MLTIQNYKKVESLEEAYELNQKKANRIVGGMMWMRMGDNRMNTAIDMSGLGLDKIEESDEEFKIGCMTTLRQLEVHESFNEYTDGCAKEALRHIVGVQFRNLATAGGSIYGRFGFSDVMTLFMALDAKVELYHAGVMEIREFAGFSRTNRDILTYIIIPKTSRKTVYLSMRNTETDFPVLTCAVSVLDGRYSCVVGARPALAQVYEDEKNLLAHGDTAESAAAFAADIASRAEFAGNMRGSAAYRRKLCEVLVRRAVLALQEV